MKFRLEKSQADLAPQAPQTLQQALAGDPTQAINYALGELSHAVALLERLKKQNTGKATGTAVNDCNQHVVNAAQTLKQTLSHATGPMDRVDDEEDHEPH